MQEALRKRSGYGKSAFKTETYMTLRIAFQMDPMETVDIDADTTFALAEVAAVRGYELFEYAPEHLAYNEGVVQARVRPMTVRREYGLSLIHI